MSNYEQLIAALSNVETKFQLLEVVKEDELARWHIYVDSGNPKAVHDGDACHIAGVNFPVPLVMKTVAKRREVCFHPNGEM